MGGANLLQAEWVELQAAEYLLFCSTDPVSPIRTYHLMNFSVVGDTTRGGQAEDSSALILLEEDSVSPRGTTPGAVSCVHVIH